MTAAIAAVSGVVPTAGPSSLESLTTAIASDKSEFATALSGAIQTIQDTQDKSADLAVQAVTGELDDVHDYTIAATEAAVTLELASTVRNQLVDAFTEIMRMQG